jgi:uncharacterized membrane protein
VRTTTGKTPNRKGVTARRRLITSAVIGLCAGALCGVVLPWELAPLVAWDVCALIYISWIWLAVGRMDARQTAAHAETEDPTRATADVLLLSAAAASLVATGVLLVRAGGTSGVSAGLQAGFAIFSVFVSWAAIHTTFTLRYAALYYEGEDGGADFHQREKPKYSDFAYLSFTVGMTFQVSDTELNDAEFRSTVLRHSLLAYLFGAVILALMINLVAGLTK